MSGNPSQKWDALADDLFDDVDPGMAPMAPVQQMGHGAHPTGAQMAPNAVPRGGLGAIPGQHLGGPVPMPGARQVPHLPGNAVPGGPSHAPVPAGGLRTFNAGMPGAQTVHLGPTGVSVPNAHHPTPTSNTYPNAHPSTAPTIPAGGLGGFKPVPNSVSSATNSQNPQIAAGISQVGSVPRLAGTAVPSGGLQGLVGLQGAAPNMAKPTATNAKAPANGASAPQAVSAKAAAAAASKPVAAGPAVKKQMLSADGQSRARQADGSSVNEMEDEEEELIPKDERVREPIMLGRGMSEAQWREALQRDEFKRIIDPKIVRVRIDSVCESEKMAFDPRIADTIAYALQRRITDTLGQIIEFSRRRLDAEGENTIGGEMAISMATTRSANGAPRVVRSSNARLYINNQEKERQEAREARIAARVAASAGTVLEDAHAKRRQEEETQETVLSFAGRRRAPAQPVLAPHAANAADSAQLAISIKESKRRVTLSDAVTFLRTDPHVRNSQLTLNVMAGLKLPDSATYTHEQVAAAARSTGYGSSSHHSAHSSSHMATRSSTAHYSSSSAGNGVGATKFSSPPAAHASSTMQVRPQAAPVSTAPQPRPAAAPTPHTRPIPGNQPSSAKGPSMAPHSTTQQRK